MSERAIWKTNVLYKVVFRVTDDNGNAVTGLANGAFTKYLYKDCASSAITVTVTEIANGQYYASYTPDSDAYWSLQVTNTSYNPDGWDDDIQTYSFDHGDLLHRKKASSVNDAGATATSFVTNLTESTDDYWKGALLILTSGALAGQSSSIKSYNGTTKAVTLEGEGLTSGPANSVTFDLVPMVSTQQVARRTLLKPEVDVESEMSTTYRCVAGVVCRETNKNAIVGDVLHVKKNDQSTDLFTANLTRDSSQTPVSEVDPL